MSNLFNKLAKENLLNDYAETIDWLFDDNRFSAQKGWTSGYVGAFIKYVKKMPNLGKDNYQYGSINSLKFPTIKNKDLITIHSKGVSESRDLVRHIRNGIAHGKTTLYKPKGELSIEILDYNKHGEQTAYIFMPLKHLMFFYNTYVFIKNKKKGKTQYGNKRF